jgi:hypothetical protein
LKVKAVFAILVIIFAAKLYSQGYDDTFEMRNKLKFEYQYSDYLQYEYPEPLLFTYGVREYTQNRPYIANFPEQRSLLKFTRLVGRAAALSGKYQFSNLTRDVNSHLFDLKYTHTLQKDVIIFSGIQMTSDSRGFNAYQPGIGLRYEISKLSLFQTDLQYYIRGRDAKVVGGWLNSLNFRFKFRQVLTVSTACMFEYIYYNAVGQTVNFESNTFSLWLSQHFVTQTAVHFNLRYYSNSAGIYSLAPSLEVAQYLNWATILRLKYRYYSNESGNLSLGEIDIIIPDNLRSNTLSVQINRELSASIQIYGKYRYYKSNQNIEMNTYLTGIVYSF